MSDGEVCSHIKVVVRVRPLNDKEKDGNHKRVVHVVDNHMLIFDPKEEEVTFFRGQRVGNRDVRRRANKDLKFVFDSVFREDSSQVEVFENTTKAIVDGVLNGYNCTVFAYGATGAGKTHTMLGSSDAPGVMFLTVKELFARMDLIKEDKVFNIAFSYLEVYNEQIRDLLTNSGPLAVREDGSNGVVVQGLTLHQPKSAEHILEALDYGNRNRTQHPTDMNATSSRSHAVFQIYLRQQDKTASLNPNVRVAKMSLIDLAGSERASATNAKGARLREGANINRSLLALGNVINTLANPKCKKTHIPYRDSKLTRLLKDSLGGNCRTVMIANVSPFSLSYEDTHNTLKYANRAKEIKSTTSLSNESVCVCLQIVMLKQKLKEYEERKVAVPVLNPIPIQRRAEFEKMSESLRSVFAARLQVRKEHLDIEKQLNESRLTMTHKELWHQQSLIFFPDNRAERATCKYERKLASLKSHQEHLQKRLMESEKRFQENEGWLHRIENEMKLLGHEGHSPEELKRELQCHQLQLRITDLQQHIEHMSHLISAQDQENTHTHKLVNALLSVCCRQNLALKAASIATDDAEWEELERLVRRERGVVWADQEKAEDRDDGGTGSTHLQPILSFSHLVSYQSTPCSSEKHTHRTSQRLRPTRSSKGELISKPIRRKLSVSPANPDEDGPIPVLSHYPPAIQEVLKQEGMFPLQYTPEGLPHTSSSFDPNTTIDIGYNEDPAGGNATVILSPEPPGHTTLRALRANNGNEPAKRLEIPSLLDLRKSKPSYMAMTSAAQVKRKFNCSNTGKEDSSQATAAAPKRIKRDPCEASKPLRIRRFGVSSENEPSRRVVRSVSEGNLHQLDQRKPKLSSMRPAALFKKVTKRM
uniref:Kinesin-like protein n=1 Tax=Sinocyclocheilus grahami TaxID=75366 RepID=A0A672M8K4_SINGR